MHEERLANRQLFAVLFIIRTTISIGILPVLTTADALQDAWLSVLVAMSGALFLAWIITALGIRFPGETIMQYGSRLLGPWLGRAVNLFYLWMLLHVAAIEVRFYGEVLLTGFLSETPLLFVIGSMVLLAAVAAFLGVEVIGRLAELILPLFGIAVLTSLIVPLPAASLANLEPVLARGLDPVLRGSVTPIAIGGAQLILVSFMLPSLVKPKRAVRWVLGAVAVSFLVLLAVAIINISVLGAAEGARSVFPFFRMVRAVRVSTVLERIEALIIFAWGMGLFIGLASYLWAGARGVAQFFNLSQYRALVPPMAVVWALLGYHNFQDIFEMSTFLEYRFAGPYMLAVTLIPMLILWPAWWIYSRRKGGGRR